MAVELPNSRNIFLPQLPEDLSDPKVVREYMQRLVTEMEKAYTRNFDNVDAVRNVVHSGTSGTFIDSLGATVTVVNGIITALS